MKILDCTLRDGGYYTNWDFDKNIVNQYIKATNILPIDYLEIGYRNNPSKEYLGKYGYTPQYELEDLRNKSTKKLVLMLNEKSTLPKDLSYLLDPISSLVNMIRLAVDPQNFDRAVILAEEIKKRGFEVGFNTMYMSKWKNYNDFYSKLHKINGIADLFCMVDSFGGIMPNEIKEIYAEVKQNTTCPIGFHGHNNLQLGLINTLTAIECGVDYVDATVLGMGRGAGNLKMELLLTVLNKQGLEVDFNVLGDIITVFTPLYEKYQWGTNLPYMLSGANSLPQKDVMDWVGNRTYTFNSIVRALDNKRSNVADNAQYPLLQPLKSDKVLIIGGGESAKKHNEAIKEYLKKEPNISVIFATAKYADIYNDLTNNKFYCLVGNEAKRLTNNINKENFKGICVLAPYPRKMGTDVPPFTHKTTFELKEINFTKQFLDSCTTLALQTALHLSAQEILIVGYDGYMGEILYEKETSLTHENRSLFHDFKKHTNLPLKSLTPTLYKELNLTSIYQFL